MTTQDLFEAYFMTQCGALRIYQESEPFYSDEENQILFTERGKLE